MCGRCVFMIVYGVGFNVGSGRGLMMKWKKKRLVLVGCDIFVDWCVENGFVVFWNF